MATEALREVSAIGKEMIDGNRAVAAVVASIVMDSNVFPSRNSTRDKETTKEVVDAINKYGLIPAVGQAEVWKGSYFLEFKVGQAHALARWAICKACIANKDYHLARVSRGGATAKDRGTSNVRTHLRIHHPADFEDLMKRDGRVVLDGGGMTSYFKSTQSRGAPAQIEVDTLDSLLRLVTESLDPWERISSTSLRSFATSIHPKAWVPSIPCLQEYARVKAIFCRDTVNARLVGQVLTGALDTWTSMAGSIFLHSLLFVVVLKTLLCLFFVFTPLRMCPCKPLPPLSFFLLTSLVHMHRRHVHGPHLPLH